MSSDSEDDGDMVDMFAAFRAMTGDSDECHGEAGGTWKHRFPEDSRLAGVALKLRLPDVTGSNSTLFAHYVWNSAIVLSNELARGRFADLAGAFVCELGAGTGLPSITASRLGAAGVRAAAQRRAPRPANLPAVLTPIPVRGRSSSRTTPTPTSSPRCSATWRSTPSA